MADDLEDVIEETLKKAMGTAALLQAARVELAPRITFLITEHAQQGKFLGGGEHEGSSYSEKTLPAYYLGELQKSGDRWQLRNEQLNKTVTPRSGGLEWRTKPDGSSVAFLLGGYREFRRLAGRTTSFVNLTFTGRMLGSVTSETTVGRNRIRITTGATGGQQDKAAYTNAMYEWLGLFDKEQTEIKKRLIDFIDDKIDGSPDVTINLAG